MSEERLKKIEDSLARIEGGLFGDDAVEHWGLFKRVANQGKRLRRLEVWAASLVVSGGTLVLIYKIIVDWWPH